MSDLGREDSQMEEQRDDEMGSQEVTGLGVLLKNEREKNNLSHEQVAQMTKLRKHFLEALENEDWDSLTPAVFVKGFIRSYAQALGLDEKKALSAYGSIAPVKSEPPKPLVGLHTICHRY